MLHYVAVPDPKFTVGLPCSYDAIFSHSEKAALYIMNILAMSPCAAKIWDYASPIMLLKMAIVLLSMLEISLLISQV
jgi:hypothetical protein